MRKQWKKPIIVTVRELELEDIIIPGACSGRWEWL